MARTRIYKRLIAITLFAGLIVGYYFYASSNHANEQADYISMNYEFNEKNFAEYDRLKDKAKTHDKYMYVSVGILWGLAAVFFLLMAYTKPETAMQGEWISTENSSHHLVITADKIISVTDSDSIVEDYLVVEKDKNSRIHILVRGQGDDDYSEKQDIYFSDDFLIYRHESYHPKKK